MSNKNNDFKIGLFVLGALGLLMAALFAFGASRWFRSKTLLETYLPGGVQGLKTGTLVTLRGVPIGTVTRINFTWNIYHRSRPRFVYVEFEVQNKIALAPPGKPLDRFIQEEVKKGLRARVNSEGLLGRTILSLVYVNPSSHAIPTVPWKPRHLFIPSIPSRLQDIVSNLDRTLHQVQQVDFQKIGGLIQQDLVSGRKVLRHADAINFQGIGTNVNRLVTQLRGVSDQLHDYLGGTNSLDQTNLATLTRHADQTLGQLKSVVARLDRKAASLDVSSFNASLENIRRVTEELTETLAKIKRYPAGALLGRPPPPAKDIASPKQQ